jgi:hypothetical protein
MSPRLERFGRTLVSDILSDLGELWYRISLRKAAEQMRVFLRMIYVNIFPELKAYINLCLNVYMFRLIWIEFSAGHVNET